MISVVFLLIASFLLSLLLVFLIIQNFSKQLLDIPNERSSHVRPTPRGAVLTGVGFLQKHSDEGEDLRGQGWKVDKEEGQYCEGFARKSYCEDEVMSNE